MALNPGIVVTTTDGASELLLVAEANLSSGEHEGVARELKEYLWRSGCPIGLLITPDRLRIYRHRYLSTETNSVVLVGDFDICGVFGAGMHRAGRDAADDFEWNAQLWLESMVSESALLSLPPDLRVVARQYIVPALSEGRVHAGHPRFVAQ